MIPLQTTLAARRGRRSSRTIRVRRSIDGVWQLPAAGWLAAWLGVQCTQRKSVESSSAKSLKKRAASAIDVVVVRVPACLCWCVFCPLYHPRRIGPNDTPAHSTGTATTTMLPLRRLSRLLSPPSSSLHHPRLLRTTMSPPLTPALTSTIRRRALSSTSSSSPPGEKPLLVTRTPVEGGAPGAVIATLAMNRPKARNALSRALVAEVGGWKDVRV